jgi:hypothetical protein
MSGKPVHAIPGLLIGFLRYRFRHRVPRHSPLAIHPVRNGTLRLKSDGASRIPKHYSCRLPSSDPRNKEFVRVANWGHFGIAG